MRKITWLAAQAVLAVSGTYAYADAIIDGTFNFTVTGGSPTPTGSFVWDSTTSTWNSFTVDWNGAVFNFAGIIGNLADLPTSGGWCAAGPAIRNSPPCPLPRVFPDPVPGSINLFKFPSGAPVAPGLFTDVTAAAGGNYTVTETTPGVPEPATVGLLFLGLASVGFARRKRKSWRAAIASTAARASVRTTKPIWHREPLRVVILALLARARQELEREYCLDCKRANPTVYGDTGLPPSPLCQRVTDLQ